MNSHWASVVCVMILSLLDKVFSHVCSAARTSSSIFTLGELHFTWGHVIFDSSSLSPPRRYLNVPRTLTWLSVSLRLGWSLINPDSGGEVFPWLTVIDRAFWWFVSAPQHNWLAIRKLRRRYWITIQKDWVSVSIRFHISSISLSPSVSLCSEYISHFQ